MKPKPQANESPVPKVPHYGHDLSAEEIRDLVGDSPFIIEVGCNDGRDTKRFLDVMPQSHVVCFECEPRALSHFLCRGNPRVTLIELAISHKTQNLTFYRSGGIPDCTDKNEPWFQSGSCAKPTGHFRRSPEITFPETLEVQARPLDYYWDEYQPPIDLLWVDAQGFEPRVILGGYHTLMQTRYAYFEQYEVEQYERGANLRTLWCMLPDFDLVGLYGGEENALFKNRSL